MKIGYFASNLDIYYSKTTHSEDICSWLFKWRAVNGCAPDFFPFRMNKMHQKSVKSCWAFSLVSISVAHKDALQLVEALCVNGADLMHFTLSGDPLRLLQATYAKPSPDLNGLLNWSNHTWDLKRPLKTDFLNQPLVMHNGILHEAHSVKIQTVSVILH